METVKKVKLLQNLPNVDKGAIFERSVIDSSYFAVVDNYNNWFKIDECVVLEKTDWFTPYIFTTEDNADIVEGDEYWAIDLKNNEVVWSIADCESLRSDWLKFKDKDKALLYLQSLKPKFKVGDIVYCETWKKLLKVSDRVSDIKNCIICDGHTCSIDKIRLANESGIISYYEKQGWVKDAKFKYGDKIYTLEYLVVRGSFVFVGEGKISYVIDANINNCELIKELEYPKSWEELKLNEGFMINSYIPITDALICNVEIVTKRDNDRVVYATESQCKSSLAFAQLTQLHAEMIRIYNKNNNCDWKPDFGYNEKYYYIRRKYNNLHIAVSSCDYAPLTFPDKECVEFALKEWNSLWKQLYELN